MDDQGINSDFVYSAFTHFLDNHGYDLKSAYSVASNKSPLFQKKLDFKADSNVLDSDTSAISEASVSNKESLDTPSSGQLKRSFESSDVNSTNLDASAKRRKWQSRISRGMYIENLKQRAESLYESFKKFKSLAVNAADILPISSACDLEPAVSVLGNRPFSRKSSELETTCNSTENTSDNSASSFSLLETTYERKRSATSSKTVNDTRDEYSGNENDSNEATYSYSAATSTPKTSEDILNLMGTDQTIEMCTGLEAITEEAHDCMLVDDMCEGNISSFSGQKSLETRETGIGRNDFDSREIPVMSDLDTQIAVSCDDLCTRNASDNVFETSNIQICDSSSDLNSITESVTKGSLNKHQFCNLPRYCDDTSEETVSQEESYSPYDTEVLETIEQDCILMDSDDQNCELSRETFSNDEAYSLDDIEAVDVQDCIWTDNPSQCSDDKSGEKSSEEGAFSLNDAEVVGSFTGLEQDSILMTDTVEEDDFHASEQNVVEDGEERTRSDSNLSEILGAYELPNDEREYSDVDLPDETIDVTPSQSASGVSVSENRVNPSLPTCSNCITGIKEMENKAVSSRSRYKQTVRKTDINTLGQLFLLESSVSQKVLSAISNSREDGVGINGILNNLKTNGVTRTLKLHQDVKKFLAAAVDAQILQMKGIRYLLIPKRSIERRSTMQPAEMKKSQVLGSKRTTIQSAKLSNRNIESSIMSKKPTQLNVPSRKSSKLKSSVKSVKNPSTATVKSQNVQQSRKFTASSSRSIVGRSSSKASARSNVKTSSKRLEQDVRSLQEKPSNVPSENYTVLRSGRILKTS